jgi:hypothetical protein
MINFLSKKAERDIIYVLDRLLQVSINGDEIAKVRNIDLAFYNLLNTPKVNQAIVHIGCLPAARQNKSIDNESADFYNKLSMYMEYDINTDFVWANVVENDVAKSYIHKKVILLKKDILDYLFKKEVITEGEYSEHISSKVKDLG